MKRHYIDCHTCGGRVELTNRPAEDGKRALGAHCHGVWYVEVVDSPPTFKETQTFLEHAARIPRKGGE